jgi:hypothetical protein
MTIAARRFLVALCLAVALPEAFAWAQSESAPPTPMTFDGAKDFVTDAGLQVCEMTEIDPNELQFTGAIKSFSIGIAKDCSTYDPANPTVVNVHQFADDEARDAMVASLQNLRFRALRAYGDVWVVEGFVIVLLGPQRAEVGELLKAEHRRRHPEAG